MSTFTIANIHANMSTNMPAFTHTFGPAPVLLPADRFIIPTYYDCATQSELFDRLDGLTKVIDMSERINQLDVEVSMRLLDIARCASRKVRRGRRTGVLSATILRPDMDGYYAACQVALDYGRKANDFLATMVRTAIY